MIHINIKKMLHGQNGNMPLDVNLEIKRGEFLAISGVSGSGKTTLLRILAGLVKIDSGEIIVNKKVWIDTNSKKRDKNFMPIQERNIGYLLFLNNLFFSRLQIPAESAILSNEY